MRFEFIIPNPLGVKTLQSGLQENIRLSADPSRILQRTCYDSFDWRLYAQDSVLEETRDGGEHRLVWRTLNSNTSLAQITLPRPPRFVQDLPPGRFRDRLEPILEMRELVPLLEISTRLHTLRVLNKSDKTVARLLIENNTVRRHGGDKSFRLGKRAIVLPVKGYQKSFKQVIKGLEAMGLTAATDDFMLSAMARIGLTPEVYSTKLNLQLEPAMRADQATRIILHRLLDVMTLNEAGTRIGTDTEFLHDFRVAIRRTRSALTQIKGVLPLRIANRYKAEFAWMGQITTPSRDLDVYLLNFDDYRDSLPASAQADIEPLRDFLVRHQAIEHKALVKALDSARYRRLLESWRTFLEQEAPVRSTLPSARRPIVEVANKRIWRIYQRALKEGHAIDAASPAEALHELRKTCKKLRYLIEFFQSLYPAARIKALIRVLKTLQDNLGNFQDYEVQVATLKAFSHQMVAEGKVPPDTLLAMGMLIDGLERRQHQAREEFAGRFSRFALPENRKHFRKLFTVSTG
ncbi:MAG: CHAD domain-containing protein [Pseudomonadota bacterium]|nr:CHAD domain-containing protein [Pseudomonadota bacterium]